MFVICSLLLLSSCDKDNWNGPHPNNFYGYNVENRDGFDMISITVCLYNQDTTFLTGIKNEKMWIGMFDEHTKEQLKEWICAENFNRKLEINLGYGEIETMRLSAFHSEKSIYKTNWGFVMIPYYTERDANWTGVGSVEPTGGGTRDILLLNGDKMIVYPLNYPSIENLCWFQESVIVLSYEYDYGGIYTVISPEGEKIAEWGNNAFESDNIESDQYPLSYTEGIFIYLESDYNVEDNTYSNYYSIIRHNYQTGKDVWKTTIPFLKDIEGDARINTTILEQSNSIWKYRIDITNRDGSKKQVTFTVDVETGKVTEV